MEGEEESAPRCDWRSRQGLKHVEFIKATGRSLDCYLQCLGNHWRTLSRMV